MKSDDAYHDVAIEAGGLNSHTVGVARLGLLREVAYLTGLTGQTTTDHVPRHPQGAMNHGGQIRKYCIDQVGQCYGDREHALGPAAPTTTLCRLVNQYVNAARLAALDGMRVTAFITATAPGAISGELAKFELRDRQRARVENRIQDNQASGLANFPCPHFNGDAPWLEIILVTKDLAAWTKPSRLAEHPAIARCGITTLHYRVLHVVARIARCVPRIAATYRSYVALSPNHRHRLAAHPCRPSPEPAHRTCLQPPRTAASGKEAHPGQRGTHAMPHPMKTQRARQSGAPQPSGLQHPWLRSS